MNKKKFFPIVLLTALLLSWRGQTVQAAETASSTQDTACVPGDCASVGWFDVAPVASGSAKVVSSTKDVGCNATKVCYLLVDTSLDYCGTETCSCANGGVLDSTCVNNKNTVGTIAWTCRVASVYTVPCSKTITPISDATVVPVDMLAGNLDDGDSGGNTPSKPKSTPTSEPTLSPKVTAALEQLSAGKLRNNEDMVKVLVGMTDAEVEQFWNAANNGGANTSQINLLKDAIVEEFGETGTATARTVGISVTTPSPKVTAALEQLSAGKLRNNEDMVKVLVGMTDAEVEQFWNAANNGGANTSQINLLKDAIVEEFGETGTATARTVGISVTTPSPKVTAALEQLSAGKLRNNEDMVKVLVGMTDAEVEQFWNAANNGGANTSQINLLKDAIVEEFGETGTATARTVGISVTTPSPKVTAALEQLSAGKLRNNEDMVKVLVGMTDAEVEQFWNAANNGGANTSQINLLKDAIVEEFGETGTATARTVGIDLANIVSRQETATKAVYDFIDKLPDKEAEIVEDFIARALRIRLGHGSEEDAQLQAAVVNDPNYKFLTNEASNINELVTNLTDTTEKNIEGYRRAYDEASGIKAMKSMHDYAVQHINSQMALAEKNGDAIALARLQLLLNAEDDSYESSKKSRSGNKKPTTKSDDVVHDVSWYFIYG